MIKNRPDKMCTKNTMYHRRCQEEATTGFEEMGRVEDYGEKGSNATACWGVFMESLFGAEDRLASAYKASNEARRPSLSGLLYT